MNSSNTKITEATLAARVLAERMQERMQKRMAEHETRLKEALIKKHWERKHGPDAYYGQ